MKLARKTLVLALVLSGCKLLGIARDTTCTEFASEATSAHWSACDDKVKREISCVSSFGGLRNQMVAPGGPHGLAPELKCDCLEDGVMKTFFFAKDPPLASREDATRVANANCRWKLSSVSRP